MVGLPPTGLRLDLDPGEFLRREKLLTGTMYGSEDPAVALPMLLEHVAAGRLELASLLGEVFPLERDRRRGAGEPRAAGRPGARRAVRPGRCRLKPDSQTSERRRQRLHRLLLQPAQVAVERERRRVGSSRVERDRTISSVTSSCGAEEEAQALERAEPAPRAARRSGGRRRPSPRRPRAPRACPRATRSRISRRYSSFASSSSA